MYDIHYRAKLDGVSTTTTFRTAPAGRARRTRTSTRGR